MAAAQDISVDVRFFPPPPDLCRYFTAFCLIDFRAPAEETIYDALLPEWGNLRFFSGVAPEAWIEGGDHVTGSHFLVTGPSGRCVHFRQGTTRLWGVAFLPLGWAHFVGVPAADLANRMFDGTSHPAFAHFAPLLTELHEEPADIEAELARFIAFFRERDQQPHPECARIEAIHAAMLDTEVTSVSQLVARSGASKRTIERTADRAFGFAPKVLLRRQRLMRSLAQFILDPSLKWIGSIDSHYGDQAQFIKDFRYFIGMSPRQYAAMPHPLLGPFIRARVESLAGVAVQTLHPPADPMQALHPAEKTG